LTAPEVSKSHRRPERKEALMNVFRMLATNNNHMKISLYFKHLGGSLATVIHCSFCHPCSFLCSSPGLNGLLLAFCRSALVRARFLVLPFFFLDWRLRFGGVGVALRVTGAPSPLELAFLQEPGHCYLPSLHNGWRAIPVSS
jgi:hypothetical protein